MIKGIGIDIVDKNRIEQVLARQGEKFLQRIMTNEERATLPKSEERRVEYISGRFAAKEAFAKATGLGFGKELSWHDVEVLRECNGKPRVNVSREWMQKYDPEQKLSFHVSISHEKKYAVAQLIIEG